MAEFIFKALVKAKGVEDQYFIESAAVRQRRSAILFIRRQSVALTSTVYGSTRQNVRVKSAVPITEGSIGLYAWTLPI